MAFNPGAGVAAAVWVGGGGVAPGGQGVGGLSVYNALTFQVPNTGVPAVSKLQALLAATTNLGAPFFIITPGTLYLPPGAYGLEANFIVPANVRLWMAKGAVFTALVPGVTLTILGDVDFPEEQIFSNAVNPFTVVLGSKVREVSAAWWGAVPGGGAAVNSAAIQAAYDATGSIVSPAGPRDLILSTGTYDFSVTLNATRNVRLRGQGIGATILNYTGAAEGIKATGTGDIWYAGIVGLTLRTAGNLPPYPATYGIRITDANHWTLERVELTRWGTAGVLFEGVIACIDHTIRECDIHENQGGISVLGNNVVVNHVTVRDSNVRASEAWNIFVPRDVRNWIIEGCNLEAGKTGGVSFSFGENIVIIGNYFEVVTAVPAIDITGVGSMNGVVIMGNNIHGTGVANGASAVTFALAGAIFGLFAAGNSISGYQVAFECNGIQTGQLGPNAFPNTIGTKYKVSVSQATAKGFIIVDESGVRGGGGNISADKGNAATTVIHGTNEQIVLYNTPISANRAVTLNIINAIHGDRVRVVRTAAATGAFTVDVGAGPLKSLAAGQWCEVTYDGLTTQTWKLIGFGSL